MSVLAEEISEKAKTLIKPIIESMGCRLFDVELKPERGWVLRVIIDKKGGVSIKDCEDVSRRISPLLDVEDLIPFSYTLEVSSPGIDRDLEKPEHYEFFTGRRVRIFLREPIREKREILGSIEGVKEGIITIRESESGEVFHIPFSAIARGRLEPQIW